MKKEDILKSLEAYHGIEPEQVTFADDGNPIFDYEALSRLTLDLTNIQNLSVDTRVNKIEGIVTATCKVTLPDGRERETAASCELGEILVSGDMVNSLTVAEAVAHSRAARRGVRAVGVNLWRAHLNFVKNQLRTKATVDGSPDAHIYREIHALAVRVGLIEQNDRSRYEQFLASAFDGVTSSRDLDPEQRERLIQMLRSLTHYAN